MKRKFKFREGTFMKRKFKFREGTFIYQIPQGDVYENSNSNSTRGRL